MTVLSPDINEAYKIFGVTLTLWGMPNNESHKSERFFFSEHPGRARRKASRNAVPDQPLRLRRPGDAPPRPRRSPWTRWEQPGPFNAEGYPELNDLELEARRIPVSAHDRMRQPQVRTQQSPSLPPQSRGRRAFGLHVQAGDPAERNPAGLATPELEDTTVTLPPGVTISPSAANGLEACSDRPDRPGIHERGSCPPASQVGTVRIKSPCSKKNSPAGCSSGRRMRTRPCIALHAGRRRSGQAVPPVHRSRRLRRARQASRHGLHQPEHRAADDELPQQPAAPFSTLTLSLRGGDRASLANPQACGSGYVCAARA